ncbi:MAG: B12-binding domain-containing radical SAM protein [bacterium]|nr:B12-binding domain-containing radical SAM protein [bacterium]
MADITLINMNMLYIKYLDGEVRRQCHLPLGPLYLISTLKDHGIETDFRDYQLLEDDELFSTEVFCRFLEDPAPIIGISCMANLIPFVLYIMPQLRERFPNSTIILGGVGTMSIEETILERFPEVDIIHRGEGEQSVPILIKALKENKPLNTVPSIFYREEGAVVHNPPLPRIKDLDSISRPFYQGMDFAEYIGHNILGSRGCPYPCTFCSITPIWEWKTYSRSNKNIVDEMASMHNKFGVTQFLFQDEFFVSSPERMIDFSRQLKASGIPVTYKVFARVDLVNEASLRAMADSGCVEIRFGIESGSDKILDLTQKGFNSNTALTTVSLAQKIMPAVDAFYVWGYPFETMEDFSASVFQMITLRGMGVRPLPSLLTYLPQTRIYNDIEDKSKLEFCSYLLPEYMISGIEKRVSVRVDIDNNYSGLFNFILGNKDIFPGFFQVDIENNIIPKLEMLEEFEFYQTDVDKSCGAHSPSETRSENKLDLALNV